MVVRVVYVELASCTMRAAYESAHISMRLAQDSPDVVRFCEMLSDNVAEALLRDVTVPVMLMAVSLVLLVEVDVAELPIGVFPMKPEAVLSAPVVMNETAVLESVEFSDDVDGMVSVLLALLVAAELGESEVEPSGVGLIAIVDVAVVA